MASRERDLYFAKLAEKAERYDEMASYMENLGKLEDQLSVEERNLLSVAYKNTIGSRRAAWRIVTSVERKEKSRGNEEERKLANEYRKGIELELQSICDAVLGLLESKLISRADAMDSKVFYMKMKADYHRYTAEFSEAAAKTRAAENARLAYEDAAKAAKDLAKTHAIRLGLALNYSVFHYEVLQNRGEACKLARMALEDAISELDNVAEDSYKDTTLIMQLLQDNLTLWMPDQEADNRE
mmetsp:Transcript_24352/g.54266  ORF Transcript_24352/g.54266 Transcript_24352/m.54266 type:complete len:241 (+) Transcript_24352:53-775(+)